MSISVSELILLGKYEPVENARILSEIAPEVELMMDADFWEYGEDGWEKQLKTFEGNEWHLSIHPPAWDTNLAAPIRPLRETALFLNKKALNFAKAVGSKQMVFHPGYTDSVSNFNRTRAIDNMYESLDELVQLAKPEGITLAFENIASPSKALFTAEEFIHALDGIDPCVQYLLDLGHANMNHWNLVRVIEEISSRVCGFHIHDNNGNGDQHLPIGYGSIQWNGVFGAMKQLPNEILYVLEYQTNTPLEELKTGVKILQQVFD